MGATAMRIPSGIVGLIFNRQRVPMLLLPLCVILLLQRARLGFLNVRSVRTLAAFNIITQSIIGTLYTSTSTT